MLCLWVQMREREIVAIRGGGVSDGSLLAVLYRTLPIYRVPFLYIFFSVIMYVFCIIIVLFSFLFVGFFLSLFFFVFTLSLELLCRIFFSTPVWSRLVRPQVSHIRNKWDDGGLFRNLWSCWFVRGTPRCCHSLAARYFSPFYCFRSERVDRCCFLCMRSIWEP